MRRATRRALFLVLVISIRVQTTLKQIVFFLGLSSTRLTSKVIKEAVVTTVARAAVAMSKA